MKTLTPQPLTAEAFAPFGDVIECRDDNRILDINENLTKRHHDLATISTLSSEADDLAKPIISIFASRYRPFPITLEYLERHPLGSQCFIPMHEKPFIVVVAKPELDQITLADLHAFISNGKQAVNYHPNVWHHYLLAPFEQSLFTVIDRTGKGKNLEEQKIQDGIILLHSN